MRERDYLLATNLAKMRIVESVLRSVYTGPSGAVSTSDRDAMLKLAVKAVEALYGLVDEQSG